MPTVEECAYAAGFMDGEGSIYIRKPHGKPHHKQSYAIAVGIGNDDIRPLFFIQKIWGGSLNPGPIRDNGKCSTRWTIVALSAAKFLKDILPYLIVKREQAILALELQASKKPIGWGRPNDDAVLLRWQQIREEIATLNSKYPGYYDFIHEEAK